MEDQTMQLIFALWYIVAGFLRVKDYPYTPKTLSNILLYDSPINEFILQKYPESDRAKKHSHIQRHTLILAYMRLSSCLQNKIPLIFECNKEKA